MSFVYRMRFCRAWSDKSEPKVDDYNRLINYKSKVAHLHTRYMTFPFPSSLSELRNLFQRCIQYVYTVCRVPVGDDTGSAGLTINLGSY